MWLTEGAEGEEPPEYFKTQMELVDQWQLTEINSEEYLTLGKQVVANTVEQIFHIGTVGEAPEVFIRSNRLHNFTPVENVRLHQSSGKWSFRPMVCQRIV